MNQYSNFYTALVQNNGIVASTAMLRFRTKGLIRMVEILLVGTHKDWRRKIRVIIYFTQLSIFEIVLPAAKNKYKMWRDNFRS
jgi:hypothetical protein